MKNPVRMIALATAAFSLPLMAMAATDPMPNMPNQQMAQQIADSMVTANADLLKGLDAKKMHDGEMFSARLATTAKFQNGTKLPEGTVLMGKVVEDDLQMQGMSKLALRIDQAKLKSGQIVPIKATIVGVTGAGNNEPSYTVVDGNDAVNAWTDQTLQVDQPNAMSGVELHSRIGSPNSGTFVSKKKSDIKLSGGSELQLAVSTQPASNIHADAGAGMQ
jgi:hypothetical protein